MTRGNRRTASAVAPGLLQVPRPDVDRLLDAATRRRICLVTAAAGGGKTTAVATWSASRHCVWFGPTDSADGLLDAVTEGMRPHVAAPPPQRAPDVSTAIGDLCSWLETSPQEELLIVFDDIHELHPDDVTTRVIAHLCRFAPEPVHLVLLSRGDPPLSLQRLQGQGVVAEIDASQLAFRKPEVNALVRATLGKDAPALANRVLEQTGGWPAATCRALEVLHASTPERHLDALHTATIRFRAYIAEEVLGHANEVAHETLRRLAILDEVRAEDTGALITEHSVLVDLARQGLVRAGTQRWTLAPPLSDYFHAAGSIDPDERARLHHQAGEQCLRLEHFADALRHLTAAQDHQRCASVVVEHGERLIDSGEVEIVLRTIERLPAHLDDPRIQWVAGHARQVRGQWNDAVRYFDQNTGHDGPLPPALAWRRALLAYVRGELDEALALCGDADFQDEDTPDEARLFSLAAHCAVLIGDQERCTANTRRAMAVAQRSQHPAAHAAALTARTTLATAVGDRRQATSCYLNAIRNAEAVDDHRRLAQLRTMRAHHLVDMGHPRNALAEAQTALRFCEDFGDPFLHAHGLTASGDARLRMGALDQALHDYDDACDLFQHLGSRFLSWSLRGRGDVYRVRGHAERARSAYEEALVLAEPCHDVFGLSAALTGLALVRATDDPAAASGLAERALSLTDGARRIRALLARGWVRLEADDRYAAHADAAEAAEHARGKGIEPALAEALMLMVVASESPDAHLAMLAEALQIWRENGYELDHARGLLLRSRLRGTNTDDEGTVAEKTLRELDIDPARHAVAGPLRVADRWAPSVSLRALGVFQTWYDGHQVPAAAWQSRKARDLLKILVARRRPVRREQLMELLWPEVDPAKAGNRLSVLLSNLREVLHPRGAQAAITPLVTDGGTVGLDPRFVHIDVEEFFHKAEQALAAYDENRSEAADLLLAAEADFTGEFLEDDPYQEWSAPLAEELRATHVAVLRALTKRLRAQGDLDRMTRYALRLLEHDHYDEDVHVDLIGALLDAERFGEARRRYNLYAQRMREISVEPRPFARFSAASDR